MDKYLTWPTLRLSLQCFRLIILIHRDKNVKRL